MQRRTWLKLALWLFSKNIFAAIDSTHFDAFWIWGGVNPSSVMRTAKTLYFLQGDIALNRAGQVNIYAQGVSIPRDVKSDVWLVYRATTLAWSPQIVPIIVARVKRWREAGNNVVGIQIDFDSGTKQLNKYAIFLKNLKAQLSVESADVKLSITGLLDWTNQSDTNGVNQLLGVVDEVIIQTYQGTKTVSQYAHYLDKLERIALPFKIGLVEKGAWQDHPKIATHPFFKGFVVFLLPANKR